MNYHQKVSNNINQALNFVMPGSHVTQSQMQI